ncbi:MAG TPA: energy transducer TonB [Prolixibacteraceae bacterium]
MKTGKYFFASTTIIFLLLFAFSSSSAFSQKESIVYIGKNGKLTTLEHADIIQKTRIKSATETIVQSLTLEDSKWEKNYSEKFRKVNDSTYQIKSSNNKGESETVDRIYYPLTNGTFKFKDIHKNQVIRIGYSTTEIPLTLEGEVIEFYQNGQKKSISEYRNNELVSNQNWTENGEKYIDNIFYSVDVEPGFIPGMKVLHQHILKSFKDAGIDISSISGSLIVGFVVTENGRIDGIRIMKGLGPNINNVAVESFINLMGEWSPAKLDNQNVRYFQVFPINFIYKEQHFETAELRGSTLHWSAF